MIPPLCACFPSFSGASSVVSIGMSLTSTACDLMPTLAGGSLHTSRVYAAVSRPNRYTSHVDITHICSTTTQNTSSLFAAAMVIRFIPSASPAPPCWSLLST